MACLENSKQLGWRHLESETVKEGGTESSSFLTPLWRSEFFLKGNGQQCDLIEQENGIGMLDRG